MGDRFSPGGDLMWGEGEEEAEGRRAPLGSPSSLSWTSGVDGTSPSSYARSDDMPVGVHVDFGGGGGGGGSGSSGGSGGSGGSGDGRGGRGRRGGRARGGKGRQRGGPAWTGSRGMNERRTVYVADLDASVTTADLLNHFAWVGEPVDCRICVDSSSAARYAFVEFATEREFQRALSRSGALMGFLPVVVRPSKTLIQPVNQGFLPRTDEEKEMCDRTVYVANIDKSVMLRELRNLFEALCGVIRRSRLLGDKAHPTRIAFVEFERIESAVAALHCSGAMLGNLAIRVTPSKTPVRSASDRRAIPPHDPRAGGAPGQDPARRPQGHGGGQRGGRGTQGQGQGHAQDQDQGKGPKGKARTGGAPPPPPPPPPPYFEDSAFPSLSVAAVMPHPGK